MSQFCRHSSSERIDATHARDPGVGDEDVDGSEGILRRRDEALDVGLVRDIAGHRQGVDLAGGVQQGLFLQVGEGDAPRAFRPEAARERESDPARAAGDDDGLARDLQRNPASEYQYERKRVGVSSSRTQSSLADHSAMASSRRGLS